MGKPPMKSRTLQQSIEKSLFQNEVIILYGTRRVGKTTLVKQILNKLEIEEKKCGYFNCESLKIRNRIETTDEQILGDFLKPYDLVVLDECQSIGNIGLILKIVHDAFPAIQIIATGSSSFGIANKTGEPLVGRNRTFTLYPFSLNELNYDLFELDSQLENILLFGLYPSVVLSNNRTEELNALVSGYLYKDILAIEGLKSSKYLIDLLKLLALQVGSEVSYNEISNTLGISIATVVKYIDLLEQCFVVFTLHAFSRNLRNEVGIKSRKIYFYDNGIRNAMINYFAPLNLRADIGALWENFCISELVKKSKNNRLFANNYFWKTYSQQEVDFIEEHNGELRAYEIKYNEKAKVKIPKIFTQTYNVPVEVINKSNYYRILL
jgi:predicted AAA+ superfamily ATPase